MIWLCLEAREREVDFQFVVRFWNLAKNKNFQLGIRLQRPGMTSPLKKLSADFFETF